MSDSTAFDEAIEEGEIKGMVRLLIRQASRKLGAPGSDIEEEMKSVRELARIERMADAIETTKSWQELLATL